MKVLHKLLLLGLVAAFWGCKVDDEMAINLALGEQTLTVTLRTEAEPEPDPAGTVSWANLESRIRSGSLSALILAENIGSIEVIDYDQMAQDIRDQLNAIARKYNLQEDDQKVKYLQESAELVGTLSSAVQREVYGGRVAELAGISPDAMKLEIDRARKRRIAREKKQQEKLDLAPARSLQPKSRNIRYGNMKSAMAEEMLLALILREPALLNKTQNLQPEMFSSELLGKVYGQLNERYKNGYEVSLSGLEDLTQEEMSHVAGILQRQDGPVSEEALEDCLRTIGQEHQAEEVKTDADIMAMRENLKKRKGYKE